MKLDSIAKAYLQQIQLDEQLLPKEETDANKMRSRNHAERQQKFIDLHPKAKEVFENSPYSPPDNPTATRQFAARIPVELETPKNPDEDVFNFLQKSGYFFTHDDYKAGVAHRNVTVGNPERGIPFSTKKVTAKIGGLLDKHNAPAEIKKKYVNDLFRSNQRTKAYDIVLTGNHHDIYGSSAGRSWTSCADKRPREEGEVPGLRRNDGNGPAARLIDNEINNNTFNAYLIPRGGDVDKEAIGRISFKQHTGLVTKQSTLFPEGRQYGTGVPAGFRKAAEDVVSSLFERPTDTYVKNRNVYDDDEDTVKLHGTENFGPEHLDAANKEINDDYKSKKLLKYVNPAFKYKTKQLKELASAMNSLKDVVKSGSFHDAAAHIKNGIKVDSFITGHAYTENPHMQQILDSVAEKFNLNDPAHHQTIRSLANNYSNSTAIGNEVIRKITGSLKAKNYDDFKNMVNLRDVAKISYPTNSSAIPVSDSHNMGDNPLEHVVTTAGNRQELSPSMFESAYMTFNHHGDNHGTIYDAARNFENQGVHGMNNVIAKLGNQIKELPDDQLAERFHSMQPETRNRFASEIHARMKGKTAQQIIDENKQHIKAITESYFEEDDSFGF